MWFLSLLLVAQNATGSLDAGARALSELRVDEAIDLLELARSEGPYRHRDHVRLYEQLGICYAYAGRQSDALRAFDRMLMLDPRAIIRYSLSPKVTLVFEQARTQATQRRAPQIELDWPRTLTVADPIPIEIRVVADPDRLLRTLDLYVRLKGRSEFQRQETRLFGPGQEARIIVPVMELAATRPEVLEMFALAKDERANEMLAWASPDLPREVPLLFEAHNPWYGSWVFWTIAGGLAIVASGAVVFAATQSQSSTFDVPIGVNR